mmetsp:Transcript_15832/g.23227  ORF Transcript_15832/g.23227 Transcript_15832/m.23227 type:complete len:226 (-) Transcript_15832:176-853(-)
MFDVEILVCPGLELGVELGVVLIGDFLVRAVKVLHVVEVEIGRSDVRAATEPPHATLGLEVAVVKVHSWAVGVAGVHYGAETTRKEGHLLARLVALAAVRRAELQTVVGCSQGLLGHRPVDNRQTAPRFLEHVAIGEHARDATPSVLPNPAVLVELSLAVDLFDGLADLVLGLPAHLLELGAHFSVGSAIKAQRVWRRIHSLVGVKAEALGFLLFCRLHHVDCAV